MKIVFNAQTSKKLIVCGSVLMFSPLLVFAKDYSSQNIKGVLTGGNITAGTATYVISSYTSDIGLGNDLTISDGVAGDSMFESGWLYRVSGDGEESVFPEPDTENFGPDNVLLTWSDVDSRGLFSAELLIEIDQPVAQAAVLTSTLVLTNIDAVDLSVDVFQYSDLDVAGSFANDVASLIQAPDYMGIFDGIFFAEFRGGGADNYQVTPFSALRSALTNNTVSNLNNTGLPMVSNDFTGAYQWTTKSVPPTGTYLLQTTTAFSTTAPAPVSAFVDLIFSDGFE